MLVSDKKNKHLSYEMNTKKRQQITCFYGKILKLETFTHKSNCPSKQSKQQKPYMRICWEHGGDGAVSGSRLKRRLWVRLGQRGEGTGLSSGVKQERSGLALITAGLSKPSSSERSSEHKAVEKTRLDEDKDGDWWRTAGDKIKRQNVSWNKNCLICPLH